MLYEVITPMRKPPFPAEEIDTNSLFCYRMCFYTLPRKAINPDMPEPQLQTLFPRDTLQTQVQRLADEISADFVV